MGSDRALARAREHAPGSPRRRPIGVGLLLAVLLVVPGCGGDETLEDRVRQYVARVAHTAEERNWRALGDFVADDYEDARGLDKQQLVAMGARYILAHQRIFVLERVASVEVQDAGSARARVYAAVAGRPLDRPDDLLPAAADVFRFDLDLRPGAGEELRVQRLDWQVVDPQEFLMGH